MNAGMRILSILSLIWLSSQPLSTTVRAQGEAPARWAIISTKSVDNGLPELLTTAMTRSGRFTLVERDEARRVADELGLESLAGAAAVAGRRQLGARLSADVLVTIGTAAAAELRAADATANGEATTAKSTADNKRLLRVAFCHSESGARLHDLSLALDEKPLDDVVKQVVDAAERVQTRIAGGIRYVVGVSPFLSKDLTHSYDNNQPALARLLESSFLDMPGIAVIEREEAQAIWNELADKPDSSIKRVMPLLIDGTYTSQRSAGDGELRFSLDVSFRLPSATVQSHKSDALPSRELAAWLTKLSQQFASRSNAAGEVQNAIRPEAQFEWLVARAHMFAQIGEWKLAIELRQAALLLKPNDVQQRLTLIGNERLLLGSIASGKDRAPTWLASSGATRARTLVAIYLDRLANEEYLIRNALVDKQMASDLVSLGGSATGIAAKEAKADSAMQAILTDAEAQRKEFVWNIAGHVFELANRAPTRTDPTSLRASFELQDGLLLECARRIDYVPLADEDFALLIRVWTNRIPDKLGLPNAIGKIRYSYFPDTERVEKRLFITHGRRGDQPGLSRAAWAAFLAKLTKAEHQTARLTGLIEELNWKWYLVDKNSPKSQFAPFPAIVEPVDAELKKYLASDQNGQTANLRAGRYARELGELKWQIDRLEEMPDPFAERRKVPATPRNRGPQLARTATDQPQGSSISVELLQVKFPVAFSHAFPISQSKLSKSLAVSSRINQRESEVHGIPSWRTWDNRIDIVWTPLEIWCMRSPGKFEKLEIPDASTVIIDDVQPDGERLWVALLGGGIAIFDRDGHLARRISSEHGLPPAEHGLLVRPLGDGKACVVGSFGKNFRAWCAIVDVAGDTPKINIFHEARQVPDASGVTTRYAADARGKKPPFLEAAFVPHCIVSHTDSDGRKLLYISRTPPNINKHPDALIVNLADLSVAEGRMPGQFNGSPYGYPREDHYISYKGQLITVSDLNGFQPVAGTRWQPIGVAINPQQRVIQIGREWHLPSQFAWLRLNLDNGTYENLAARSGDQPVAGLPTMVFAASAHYGIVGYAAEPLNTNMVRLRLDASARVREAEGDAPARVGATSVDTTRQFPLSDELRKQLVEKTKQLLAEPRAIPADSRTIYSDTSGQAFDDWLPSYSVDQCWLDPPPTKAGGKYQYVDGRLIHAEQLDKPDAWKNVWYGERGEPTLVSSATKHWFGLYDNRGLLSRVVSMDTGFRVTAIAAFEHADGYQAAAIYYCDGQGKCQRTRVVNALDERRQPLELNMSSKAAYSPRFESITAPARIGLAPYYPTQ